MKKNKARRGSGHAFTLRPIAFYVASCFALGAQANPTGPSVVSGSATIRQAGNLLQVTNSPRAIINWQSFSIGAGEITRFVQQSSASAVLNRVTTQNPSSILGTLQSNGRVFLINPNGIVFGAGSVIDTAGLVASSLNLSNADFLSGRLNFTSTLGAGSVVNQGTINAASGGSVYLVGPAVTNSGIITSPQGEVVLAAGNSVELVNPGTPNLRVEITAPDNQAVNLGHISAASGRVGIYAGLINQSGSIRADSAELGADGRIVLKATKTATLEAGSVTSASGAKGGAVEIQADVLIHAGSMQADGAQGGSIAVQARNVLSAGRISADGSQGAGGEIDVQASGRILQSSAARVSADGATGGGKVTLQAADRVFGSGTLTATGQDAGSTGGQVKVLGNEIVLLGAKIDASGDAGGGTVLIGGDFQGKNAAVQNATANSINFSTAINADARSAGDGGKVIVWSDQKTQFYGNISARGGATSGDGGFIEVSGKDTLIFGGMADAGAPNGKPGTLLLDPKFIVIDAAGGGGLSSFQLVDPNPGTGDGFAQQVVVLPNNNVVATDPNDDLVASNAGAVYLFNGTTGALISALTGGAADDQVGSGGLQTPGVTRLVNGNFVVSSPGWANGTETSAGAVTFGDAGGGVGGMVSPANSLVGASTADLIGLGGDTSGVTALGNGNYVVSSAFWQNRAGAVTWVNGTNGHIAGSASRGGAVSVSNSLVGTAPFDSVGNRITALTNGNYVASSPFWASRTGAATWVDGTNGNIAGSASPGGVVSSTNSLVGTNSFPTGDSVGHGVFALANGNYVVESALWYSAGAQVGAVTWVNGSNGNFAGSASPGGFVSASNSLVGSQTGDLVGIAGVVPLANSNYVVRSPNWKSGTAILVGAATLIDGSNGNIVATGSPSGAVSAANSLVGSAARDGVGSGGIVQLTNGNYVVVTPSWNKGGNPSNPGMGAVTFGTQTSGVVGEVSSANSLVGSVVTDSVGAGGVTALTNGNYVVNSRSWNGAAASVGAVTWGNGLGGTVGAVTPLNSLVGSTANDLVGANGVTALTNGNYVVSSASWNGAAASVGAVTWGNGLGGTVGAVSALNSLVGSTANDQVGLNGVRALTNGNYVVISPSWNGTAANVGAVTWGNGLGGTVGAVSALNSLVGSTANDEVGFNGVTALANGNYVVASPSWNGAAASVGAVTWGNGLGGTVGPVTVLNSLVGSTASDQVGLHGVTALTSGNYVVSSQSWNNVGATEAGAVTLGSGTSGTSGAVSAANSLLGTTTSDALGSGGVTPLSNGNVVVRSPSADNGTIVDAGLVHVLSPSAGGGFTNPLTFAANEAATSTITPAQITAITNTGTAVVLQANTDITLAASSNIVTNNPAGTGGAITMQAGRSVLLNSSITTDNGDLTITANDAGPLGNRDAGAGGITMAAGTTLNAGSGTVALTVGTGVLGAAGSIAVENILAGGVTLTANGALSDINLNAGGGISTTGTATATLSAGRDIVLRGAISAASGSLGLTLDAGNEVRTPDGATLTLDGGTGGLIASVSNGKTWQNAGTITMQGNSQVHLPTSGSGFAALSNNDGATLNVNSTNGFAFFSDPVLQGGIINNAGTLNLNQSTSFEAALTNASTGALNIAAARSLSMQNGQTIAGTVDIGTGGTLWVSERHGSNASFNGTAITGSGTLLVEAGVGPVADFTDVSASGIRLSIGSGGTANILSGSSTFGRLNLAGGALAGAGAITLAGGTSTWSGGTMSGTGSTTLASGATLNVNSAGTLIASRVFDNLGTVNVNGGALQVDSFASATNKGALNIASGATLSTNSTSLINASTGVLSGLGTLDLGGVARTLVNDGRIAPGTTSTTGKLTVNGNVTFGAGSSLDVRLGGAGVGQLDVLAVTGAAILAGTLNATTTGGFTPSGESFPVLTYASRTGIFGTLNLPANFTNTYNGSNLTLTHATAPLGLSWDNDSGDFLWTTAANWNLNRLPVNTDDVTLNVSGGSEARVTTGTHSIATLTSSANNSLLINGGSLTVLGAANMAGDTTVQAGTLNANGSYTATTMNVSGGAANFSGGYTATTTNVSGGAANLTGGTTAVLNLSGGTVGGTVGSAGSLSVTGGAQPSHWTAATLTAAVVVGSGAVVEKSGDGVVIVNRSLLNNGTLKLLAGGIGVSGTPATGGAVLRNAGTLELADDVSVGGSGDFVNFGTVVKTAGTGTATIAADLANTRGFWTVNGGTLNLTGGTAPGTAAAQVVNAGAGTLAFRTGTFNIAALTAVPGSTVAFTGATANFSGLYTGSTTNVSAGAANFSAGYAATTTNVSAGAANFSGGYTATTTNVSGGAANFAGGTTAVLNLSGGTVGGTVGSAGSLSVTGGAQPSHWTAATLTAAVVVGSGAVVEKSGDGVVIVNRSLLNNGTLKLLAGGIGVSGTPATGGAVLRNAGTLELADDVSVGGSGDFVNFGTVVKTAGTGTATIAADLANTRGFWTVNGGTLNLTGGTAPGTAAAQVVNAGAGTLAFRAGTFNIAALTAAPGSTVAFTGATANFSGLYTGSTTNVSAGAANFSAGYAATTTNVSAGAANFSGGYTATTTNVSGGAANFAGGTTAVLNLSGGTVGGTVGSAGSLSVTGGAQPSHWTAATLTAAVVVGSGAVVEKSGDGVVIVNRSLLNNGTLKLLAGGIGVSGTPATGGAVLRNAGTLELADDVSVGGSGDFVNFGTVVKTAGTGTATIAADLANTRGFWTVNGGTLNLTGGTAPGTAAAQVVNAGAGTLAFRTGTFNIAALTAVPGSTVAFTGATANFSGLYTGSTTNVSAGAANFNAGGTTAVLNLSGGTVGGNGVLFVDGIQPSSWTGGTIAGTVFVSSGAVLEKSGVGTVTLSGALGNRGTTKLSGGQITLSNTGLIDNSGTFELADNVAVGGTGEFFNHGTVTKTGGTGTATIGVPLQGAASGAWTVNAGTLNLSGGSVGSFTGVQTVNAGAGTLVFHAGTFSMAGLTAAAGSTVAFDGASAGFSGLYVGATTRVSAGGASFSRYSAATTDVSGGSASFGGANGGTFNVSGGSVGVSETDSVIGVLNLSGGSVGGNRLTVAGNSSWRGGTLAGTVVVNSLLDKSGLGTGTVNGVLENRGTVRLSDGEITIGGNGRLDNRGTFEFTKDLTVGGTGEFLNQGTVIKTAGTGTGTLGARLSAIGATSGASRGAWTVNAGTLNLTGGSVGTFTGVQTVNAGAGTLAFNAGTFDLAGLTAAAGSTVAFNGATARFNGIYTGATTHVSGGAATFGSLYFGATTEVSGGSASFVGRYSAATTNVSAGAATFNDTDATTGVLNLSGGTVGGNRFTVDRDSSWSGGTLVGTVVVNSLLDKSGLGTGTVNGVLENRGTVRLSEGQITIGGNGRLDNRGTFEFANDLTVSGPGGFMNQGTVIKTGGTGTATLAAPLRGPATTPGASSGAWTVNAGTLNLSGGSVGSFTGVQTVNAGAGTLVFHAGTFSMAGLTAAAGSTVAFDGASAGFSGLYVGATTRVSAGGASFSRYSAATTDVSGGSASFGGANGGTFNVSGGSVGVSETDSVIGVLNLSGGSVGGNRLTVAGNSSWRGGTLAGTVVVNSLLDKSGLGTGTVNGVLENRGTVRLSDGEITIGGNGRLDNRGTFEFTKDLTVGGTGEFLNQGTVIKTAGTGTGTLGARLSAIGATSGASRGAWTVNAGTLNLTGGSVGTFTGVQTVNAGAGTLAFNAGTFDMAGLTAAAGSTVAFNGATASFGALSNLNGTVNVNSGTLTLNAGATNSGMLDIAAGATIVTRNAPLGQTMTGVLAGSGTLSMSGTSGILLNNGVIAPGGAGAAGTLSVLGNVKFGSAGSLNVERFSNTSYDRLVVSGQAELAGNFGLTNAAPLLLSDGSFYSVLTYGSKTGTFATVNLPAPYFAFYLTDRLNVTAFNFASPIGGTVKQTANQVVSNVGTILNPPQTTTGSFQPTTIGTGSPTLPKCGASLKALVACTP